MKFDQRFCNFQSIEMALGPSYKCADLEIYVFSFTQLKNEGMENMYRNVPNCRKDGYAIHLYFPN